MSLLSKLSNARQKIELKNHTTFRIGGPAKYFFVAQSQEDFIKAVRAAKEAETPFYLLGGGSNMLVADEGFEGLVIKYNFSAQHEKKKSEELELTVEAGTLFNKVILGAVKAGYSGIEWGFGIPGTIGGAVFGNAGRLGQDISGAVKAVKVLDKNLNEQVLTQKECGFGYRESGFLKAGATILEVTLRLAEKNREEIDKTFNEAREVILHGPKFPSAGCAFKNYKLNGEDDELLKNHPELKERVRGGKIGVGYLIDQAGMKGKKVGGAQVWEGHANYVINTGGATGQEVKTLMDNVVEAVGEKYGTLLEPEVRLLGF